MKPALILPALLLCLTACKKEEVQPLKKEVTPMTGGPRSQQMIQADIARATAELEAAQQASLEVARAMPAGRQPGPDLDARANAVQLRMDETQMKLIVLNRELNGQAAVDDATLHRLLAEQRKEATARIHQEAAERKQEIDANLKKSLEVSKQIVELNDSNLALANHNLDLAKAGANQAEITRNNAKIEENRRVITELEASQAREMPQPSDIARIKELMAKMPDSAERRKHGIAMVDRMIADNQKSKEKLIAARDKLVANRNAPEAAADAQASIDKMSREIEALEQRKRDEEKALQEFLLKSSGSP